MKNTFLIILLAVASSLIFSFTWLPFADTYKVIKVNGEITYKRTSKNMQQGDQFSENEELIFKTSESRAAVISIQKGRFILAPGVDKNKITAKANLLPPASNISSRDGALLNVVDLQSFFSGKLVILEREKIEVGKDNFPLNETCRFFLTFIYNGEVINKKLDIDGDKVVFDRSSILSIDNKPFSAESLDCKLSYINEDNQVQAISEFVLVLPQNESMKSEIEILLKESKASDVSQKTDEVLSYLKDFYGKALKSNVSSWLKQNCGVK